MLTQPYQAQVSSAVVSVNSNYLGKVFYFAVMLYPVSCNVFKHVPASCTIQTFHKTAVVFSSCFPSDNPHKLLNVLIGNCLLWVAYLSSFDVIQNFLSLMRSIMMYLKYNVLTSLNQFLSVVELLFDFSLEQ